MDNTKQQVANTQSGANSQKAQKFGIISLVMRAAELGFSLIFLRTIKVMSSPSVPRTSGLSNLMSLISLFAPGILVILAWIFAIMARSNDKNNGMAKAALITNIVIAALKILAIIAIVLWFNHMMANCYVTQVGHE